MTAIRTWLANHLDAVFDIGVGLTIGAALIGLAVIYRDRAAAREPMDAHLPAEAEGCPLAVDLPAGYVLLGRGVIGRDAGRAYPRTVSIYTAPDGSWLIGHDPIGAGGHLCVADQGIGFALETTGRRP